MHLFFVGLSCSIRNLLHSTNLLRCSLFASPRPGSNFLWNMVKIGSFAGDSLLQVLASLERRLGNSLGLSSDLLSILDGLASTNGLRLLQGSILGPELFSLLSITRSLLGLCLPWFPGLLHELHDLSSLSVPLSISSLLGGFLGSLISCDGVSLPEGQPIL